MKKVYDKTAYGVVMLIYCNLLLSFQEIADIDILGNTKLLILLVLCGLPFGFILGRKLSKGYDKKNNNDILFNIIGMILVVLILLQCLYLKNRS
jgi:hypothetical protein